MAILLNNELGSKLRTLPHFSLSELPAGAGVLFEEVALHPSVGREAVALLIDPEPEPLLLGSTLDLRLKAGLASTKYGPVLFMIWWIPPIVNGRPVAFYEQVMNPLYSRTATVLKRLAEQSHLHFLVIDDSGDVRNILEYRNNFSFDQILAGAEGARVAWHGHDEFSRAKQAYEQMYEIDELLAEEG